MGDNQPPSQELSGRSNMAAGSLGAGIGTVVMWYLNTFVWPGKIPLEIATLGGGIVATISMTLWSILAQLLKKGGINV